MPVLAPDLVQDLRKTNSRLRFWLDSLTARQTAVKPSPATPQEMEGLLAELMRAGQQLRDLPAARDPELEGELSAYRKNVERLRTLLPSIHADLLEERARLEQERARVEAAAEWARRSRETL
jgi:chromosome segregation ATPase